MSSRPERSKKGAPTFCSTNRSSPPICLKSKVMSHLGSPVKLENLPVRPITQLPYHPMVQRVTRREALQSIRIVPWSSLSRSMASITTSRLWTRVASSSSDHRGSRWVSALLTWWTDATQGTTAWKRMPIITPKKVPKGPRSNPWVLLGSAEAGPTLRKDAISKRSKTSLNKLWGCPHLSSTTCIAIYQEARATTISTSITIGTCKSSLRQARIKRSAKQRELISNTHRLRIRTISTSNHKTPNSIHQWWSKRSWIISLSLWSRQLWNPKWKISALLIEIMGRTALKCLRSNSNKAITIMRPRVG